MWELPTFDNTDDLPSSPAEVSYRNIIHLVVLVRVHHMGPYTGFSQSEEISLDLCCFYGGGIRHNEDIMHSFQNFIVRLIPNDPPPLETRIWKLVVRALSYSMKCNLLHTILD